MNEEGHKRSTEDTLQGAELKHARDLVRRHRREVADCRARVVELEAYVFALENQLTEAKAAVGHMTMLVLRGQQQRRK